MGTKLYTVITGTGSYIPPTVIHNDYFLDAEFYDPASHKKFETPNAEIIRKFNEITNIEERRYAEPDQATSHLATFAAEDAIQSSGFDREKLEFIIAAHNFGDIYPDTFRSDMCPAIANRVKLGLGIKNHNVHTHDVVAGCPGWTTAMIVANAYIKSGMFKCGLVVGSDLNSRVSDPYDRDRMIFSDGAGAVIVEAVESETPVGILSHSSRSDIDPGMLKMGVSLNPDYHGTEINIRMAGHKVYAYALSAVPGVVKESLDKADLHLTDIKKVLIHQANEKMDEAILQRVFKLYGIKEFNIDVMPMTIRTLGNSSTATVPTLLDLILKNKMEDHIIESGDNIILTSVGAGMVINSIVYRLP
ncbi:MAG: 3-oxoacyl-ACP synthase III family protein [Prolixibacteraceae bacterium]|jgi:3-oxoacyl-[acyl-carrier-protein] synthase-3|nr:3-oxoacyl-ACP synthase III family protein [Prolixibacteraceae bacterium]